MTDSCVYFIRCGAFVKIGRSVQIRTRFSAIKTSNPHDVELIGKIPGGADLEAAFHERFRLDHHRGEWFRYSDAIRQALVDMQVNAVSHAKILAEPAMSEASRRALMLKAEIEKEKAMTLSERRRYRASQTRPFWTIGRE